MVRSRIRCSRQWPKTEWLLGSASDPIQIESIEVTPDPPKPGQDLTVLVKGTAQDAVEARSFTYSISWLCLTILIRREHTPM